MKKGFVLLFLLACMTTIKLHAVTFTNAFPGGKNYIDPQNFIVTNNSIESIDPFLLKGDTDYTLRFPGDMRIGLADVYLYSENDGYLVGTVIEIPSCDVAQDFVTCTFHTSPGDHTVSLIIEARDVDLFHSYYGFLDYQLEEGNVATAYEEYVAPYQDLNDPEFNGSGAFVKAYYETITLTDIISNHIVALDEVDGDISEHIVIEHDNYTANMHTVGTHIVELSVSDSSGNTSYFEFSVIVKDEIDPIITGPNEVSINVNDTVTITEIINTNFSANDEYDGPLTISLIADEYSESSDVLGDYNVELQTIDSSGNITTKSLTIHVFDDTPPYIVSDPNVVMYLSSPQTIDYILQNLEFGDNYNAPQALVVSIDTDMFTPNMTTVGTYSVDLSLMDLSGNIASETIHVTVIDDIKPTINGPDNVEYSYTNPPTTQDIINVLTVSDNHDAITLDDLIILTDTYTQRNSVIGSYTITVEAVDHSGNKTQHTVIVHIIDDQEPVFYVDSHLVTVTPQALFKPYDALNMLIANGVVPEGDYQINVLSDEYTGNETIPGKYALEIQLINNNGEAFDETFTIQVIGENQEYNSTNLVRTILVYTATLSTIVFVLVKYNKK